MSVARGLCVLSKLSVVVVVEVGHGRDNIGVVDVHSCSSVNSAVVGDV